MIKKRGMIWLLRTLIVLTAVPCLLASVLMGYRPGPETRALYWLALGTLCWLTFQLGKAER